MDILDGIHSLNPSLEVLVLNFKEEITGFASYLNNFFDNDRYRKWKSRKGILLVLPISFEAV